MRIGAVIVNYNSQELVIACLASLQRYVSQKLVCIVVDNSEQDDTQRIREAYPETLIVRTETNNGFAAGCNQGLCKAMELRVEYVLLLNPDTLAHDDFVSPLLQEMEQNHGLGAVGPKIVLNDALKSAWYNGATMNWWLKGPVHLKGDALRDERRRNCQPVPFLSGCAMFLRVKMIESVGFMDEDYFLYFEDADYCQRMLASGWQIGFVPQSVISHRLSATIGVQSVTAVYFIARNRIKFLRRWARWYQFIAFLTFTTLVKLPGALVVFGCNRRRFDLVKAFYRGYCNGLFGR